MLEIVVIAYYRNIKWHLIYPNIIWFCHKFKEFEKFPRKEYQLQCLCTRTGPELLIKSGGLWFFLLLLLLFGFLGFFCVHVSSHSTKRLKYFRTTCNFYSARYSHKFWKRRYFMTGIETTLAESLIHVIQRESLPLLSIQIWKK